MKEDRVKNKYLDDLKDKIQKEVEKNLFYKLDKYYLHNVMSLEHWMGMPCQHCNQMNLIHITPKEDGLYIVANQIDFPFLNKQELEKLLK